MDSGANDSILSFDIIQNLWHTAALMLKPTENLYL